MKKRIASRIILAFMWTLVGRYTAERFADLWIAMDEMIRRYGYQFVADSIRKSKAETELALINFRKEATA